MNYSKLTREEAIKVIAAATNRIKEIDFETVEGIVSRMKFYYPTNQVGGQGWKSVEVDYQNRIVNLELTAYGCNYNHPDLENQDEIREALEKIGYSLVISIDD